jgi:hypothetical protein
MKHWASTAVVALTLLCFAFCVQAETLRDPTLAPPEVSGPDGNPALSNPLGVGGMAVVVREGKSYLVVGTRLYAPGQKVGQLRLKRITETEVWLQDGSELRKVPRFSGIQRKVTVPVPPCGQAAPAEPSTSKSSSKSKSKSKATPPVVCDSPQQ